MVVNFAHPSNVLSEIEVRFSGKRTDANDDQSRKASLPTEVILFGRAVDASDEHWSQTPLPSVVILFGSVIDANDEHP